MRGVDFCFWHDSGAQTDMLEASRKGGARRSIELPEVNPVEPEEGRRILAGLVEGVISGAVSPAKAKSVGYLLNLNEQILKDSEFQRRLNRLEELAEERAE